MDLYDEDLLENKFFRALEDKFPNLFDVATCNRCTVSVNCGLTPEDDEPTGFVLKQYCMSIVSFAS